MRSAVYAAVAALASSVLAQTTGFDAITKPAKDETIAAGETYTVEWTPAAKYTGTVKLGLIGGASNLTLVPMGDIGSGIQNSAGKYEWAVGAGLGKDNVYGLTITLEKDTTIFQYSNPFHIKGSKGGSSSSASSGYSTSTKSGYSTSEATTMTYSTKGPYTTVKPHQNTTMTYPTGGGVTKTSTSTYNGGSTPTPTTSRQPSTVPTAGAAHVAAGSLAALGGLAMAVFAL
jgi:hypothetical protein